MTQNNVQVQMETLFERVRKWLETFLGLEKKGRLGYSRVMPYMHCLRNGQAEIVICDISGINMLCLTSNNISLLKIFMLQDLR